METLEAPTTAAKATTRPLIGQPWPAQGGILAAILAGAVVNGIQQPDVAVIVPMAGTAGHFESIEWGAYGTLIEGANCPYDGAANTAAMVAAELPLALAIRNLDIDGHTDWFLPARRQLQAIAATVPAMFDQDDWYWSSTQYSAHGACCQYFSYGDSYWYDKDDAFRAVALRQIQL